jgi:hypothetical protein
VHAIAVRAGRRARMVPRMSSEAPTAVADALLVAGLVLVLFLFFRAGVGAPPIGAAFLSAISSSPAALSDPIVV